MNKSFLHEMLMFVNSNALGMSLTPVNQKLVNDDALFAVYGFERK